MKLAVISKGHVGLITCVTFSTRGHHVIGTDVDERKIDLSADRPNVSRAEGG